MGSRTSLQQASRFRGLVQPVASDVEIGGRPKGQNGLFASGEAGVLLELVQDFIEFEGLDGFI
jgi:hypothetical protein